VRRSAERHEHGDQDGDPAGQPAVEQHDERVQQGGQQHRDEQRHHQRTEEVHHPQQGVDADPDQGDPPGVGGRQSQRVRHPTFGVATLGA
jgi:hypothetical protein